MSLFHYTDVNAVKAIIEHGEMWLTDMRFLNDSEEMTHGVELIMSLINGRGVQERISKEYAVAATDFITKGLSSHVGTLMNLNPIFVCSFSRAPDLLSQWRAYGNYALEFCEDSISHDLYECLYGPQEKGRRAYDATLTAVRGLGRSMRSNSGVPCLKGLRAYSDLAIAAATLKHESFSEEQEIRMLVEKIDCSFPLQFRSRSGVLIPYIKVPFPFHSIKAVHVGPMRDQDLACSSMSMFVDEIIRVKQADGSQCSGINVIRSTTPFRSN
ncbi:DUF2971 domain-containing protein [Pseudomonas sp. WMBT8]|uniref:DUF2971 domain-containing protein n=1 Tax=Pseudomonas sp. WMBT8 TaxID=3414496 RepID=UPI003D8010F6